MKKTMFVVMLAVVLVVAFASSAYAVTPHGGFSATSTQCKSCHTIHKGVAARPYLFSIAGATYAGFGTDTVANSCMYCHAAAIADTNADGHGTGAVYSSLTGKSMHKIGWDGNAPDDAVSQYVASNFTCKNCHTTVPHGQGFAGEVTIAGKVIGYDYGADMIAGNADDPNTVNEWCGRCHSDNLLTDGSTHKLYTAADGGSGTTAAYVANPDCTSCHNAEEFHVTDEGGAFTDDADVMAFNGGTSWAETNQASYASASQWDAGFTTFTPATNVYQDGYCALCHVQTGGALGVGITF